MNATTSGFDKDYTTYIVSKKTQKPPYNCLLISSSYLIFFLVILQK